MKISAFASVSYLWGPDDWKRHSSPRRFLVNLLTWPRSSILRSSLPLLLVLAAWTCAVWSFNIRFTPNALTYITTPLGLLLAFRVQSVVARFHEARQQWGKLIYVSRDLASMLAAAEPPVLLSTRLLCCKLLIAFGWATKANARPDDNLEQVLVTLLPPDQARGAAGARKPALAILSMLRRTTLPLPLPHHAALGVQSHISELNSLYGGMERLLSTPLSPTYLRHASRGLMLWLTLLPCGLLSAGCTTRAKLLLVVLSTAYVMLGIDEIGVQIEQPFDVLPLHGMAKGLTNDVRDQLLPDAPT